MIIDFRGTVKADLERALTTGTIENHASIYNRGLPLWNPSIDFYILHKQVKIHGFMPHGFMDSRGGSIYCSPSFEA